MDVDTSGYGCIKDAPADGACTRMGCQCQWILVQVSRGQTPSSGALDSHRTTITGTADTWTEDTREERTVSITYNEDKKFETPRRDHWSLLLKNFLSFSLVSSVSSVSDNSLVIFLFYRLSSDQREERGTRTGAGVENCTPGSCLPPGTLTFAYYLFLGLFYPCQPSRSCSANFGYFSMNLGYFFGFKFDQGILPREWRSSSDRRTLARDSGLPQSPLCLWDMYMDLPSICAMESSM